MKIFDCFTFHNELDILELRLKEHWDYVDYFVIVEGNKTFKGNAKPYYLLENWDRFNAFHDKIIHVRVDDLPDSSEVDPNLPSTRCREHHQRNCIARGLSLADPDDIIMVSDVDELVRPEVWKNIRQNEYDLWAIKSPIFYFKFNFQLFQKPWDEYYTIYNIATHAKHKYLGHNQRRLRDLILQNQWSLGRPVPGRFKKINVIEHGGWHFTYMGDDNFAKNKVLSDSTWEWAEIEQRVIDLVDIKKSIQNNVCLTQEGEMRTVALDSYMPVTILNDLVRWKDYLILDNIETAPNVLIDF
jgi:hypothetical protein